MENMTTTADHHNDSHFYEDEGSDWDLIWPSINVMSAVIYSVVCVLGVSGNGVVIWATGFRMEKTVSTVWYLNLAVADFLVTAFLPLAITENALDGHWPFGRFMCKMDGLVFHVNMYASVFTLAVISGDRCVGVVRPLWARCSGYRTVRKASWVSLAVWVLALALSSPHVIFRDTRPYSRDEVWCYNNYALVADYGNRTAGEIRSQAFRFRVMIGTTFVAGFLVPFSVVVSCYSVIIYRLRNNRQSGRSFKIIASVIVAFFLCWLPFHIVLLIYSVNYPVSQNQLIVLRVFHFGVPITYALALVNSCLNPLLYVVLGQGFKDVFRSRSILKVLEKAFHEETAPTDPDVTPPETEDPDLTSWIDRTEENRISCHDNETEST